jgi:hypothetical protein
VGKGNRPQRPEGMNNRGKGPGRESEGLIVARKRVTTVERRGPLQTCCCKKKGEPLGRNSHYGAMAAYRSLKKQASGDGLPEKLSLLRQKLSQKAKQEPKFRFYALYDRSIGAMCWRRRWCGCEPTRARPGWTA